MNYVEGIIVVIYDGVVNVFGVEYIWNGIFIYIFDFLIFRYEFFFRNVVYKIIL